MDLILWRHAEAEDLVSSDLQRQLTPKGRKQARKMAAWLKQQIPSSTSLRCLASQALRSQQTLAAYTDDFTVLPSLNPSVSAGHYLSVFQACAAQASTDLVAIVGHQPEIGRVASLLLTGCEADWSVKKGAIWWLRQRQQDGVLSYQLRAMLTTQLLTRVEDN